MTCVFWARVSCPSITPGVVGKGRGIRRGHAPIALFSWGDELQGSDVVDGRSPLLARSGVAG